jgi:hypothetical protein
MLTLFTFYEKSYLNEEVSRTEPSPSVMVPLYKTSMKARQSADLHSYKRHWLETSSPESGNTKGGSITVPLTSCLTGLESAV